MEFKVNSKELEKLLTRVFPAINSRVTQQIYENFLFDLQDGVLTVLASDGDHWLKASTRVVSDTNYKGVISAKLLLEAIKSLEDTTLIIKTDDKKKFTINWETGEFHLSSHNATGYPEVPEFEINNPENVNFFTIAGNYLKESIDKTAFSISKEEYRPSMTGTLFEFSEDGMRFVSTDAHRLVELLHKNTKIENNTQIVVAGNTTSILSKILDEREVKVYFNSTYIAFVLNDISLVARLIMEKFPDYKNIIPKENEFSLSVNPKSLLQITKRMLLVSPAKMKKIKWNITNEKLDISVEDIDTGSSAKENLLISYKGDSMEIGFNGSFLSDIISHLTEFEEVVFKLMSNTKPVIVSPTTQKENFEIRMLIMPVRLNG